MNLVEAVFSISNYKERYFMKQFIVHHIYRASHAIFEEIIITRFALGYTCFGGGFSYCAAGISGRGAADREEREELYYQKLEVKVFKDKSFLQRFEKEEEKLTAESELYLKYAELVKEHKRANKESKEIAKQIKEAVATAIANRKLRMEEFMELTQPVMNLLQLADSLGCKGVLGEDSEDSEDAWATDSDMDADDVEIDDMEDEDEDESDKEEEVASESDVISVLTSNDDRLEEQMLESVGYDAVTDSDIGDESEGLSSSDGSKDDDADN